MIDLKKRYTTRDGQAVELFAIRDGRVFGRIGMLPSTWGSHGSATPGMTPPLDLIDLIDLVEVKPEIQREFWVNIYPSSQPIRAKVEADKCAVPGRIACVRVNIVCHEGDGLEDGE